MTTTHSEEARQEAVLDVVPIERLNAEARPWARAKQSLTTVTRRSRELARHWVGQSRQTWDGLWETSLAEQHPASPRDLRQYIHAAAWVPGDVPLLEFLGRLYGYLVALPASFALYTIAWLLQRPGRALLTAFIVLIVWFTAS